MTTATYVLEVDFNNDGDFSDSYEDVTPDLVEVECERGRDYASQIAGRSSAGRLSAVLRNTSGKYSSFNSGSPLYGNVLPGRLVRLRTTSPSSVTLWTGYLDGINPVVSAGQLPQARLTAVGSLSRLTQVKVSSAVWTNQPAGVLVDAALTAAGWSGTRRAIDTGGTTFAYQWMEGAKSALDEIRDIEIPDLGFLYEDGDGYIVYEAGGHRALHSPHTVSQATFSDAAGAARRYATISQEDMLRDVFNQIMVAYAPYTSATVTLWTDPYTSGPTTVTYPPGFSFSQQIAPATGQFVNSWITPVPTTDYLGVDGSDGVTNRTAQPTLTLTNKTGRSTLLNVAINTPYYVRFTTLRVRGTLFTRGAVATYVAEDATSQAKYGVRALSITSPWITLQANAQTIGVAVLDRFKEPHPIVTISIRGNRDSTHMTEALTRKISDRITVVATGNQTQLGISGDFYIENIRHAISQGGGVHVTTFALSPV